MMNGKIGNMHTVGETTAISSAPSLVRKANRRRRLSPPFKTIKYFQSYLVDFVEMKEFCVETITSLCAKLVQPQAVGGE